jgi:ABC-2 type transport system permease protein
VNAQRIGVIVAHESRLLRRDITSVMVMLIFPIISIAFLAPAFKPALRQLGFVHSNGAEHVVPGQAVMAAFFVVSLVVFSFFGEHAWQTWDRVRASSATSLEIVTGKAIPRVVLVVVQLVLLLVAGVVVFHMHVNGTAVALAPVIVVFALCLVMLGVCVTALARTAQQANAFAFTGMVLFGALGGAFVPFALLPAWAKPIGPVTPTYWAMRGMRSVVLEHGAFGAVLLPTLVLLGMSMLFALIAARRMRFDEAKVGWS